LLLLVLGGFGYGGWYFHQHFEIEGLDGLVVRRKEGGETVFTSPFGGGPTQGNLPPVVRDDKSIRIASFNIQDFGESKAAKPQVMQVLAEVVRRFDVIAIQEIRTKNPDLLPRFLQLVNSAGRKYDYVIGQRLGRTTSKEQYAYIFDTASIEIDRTAMYTVADPDDLLHRPPLVAAFRVRGAPVEDAFTFTLINIHTDPDETDTELNFLDDVYRAVRNDGRGEDDVILLGDLNVDDRHLGQLGQMSGVAWLISGVPTNTRGTKLYDNMLLHRPSTTEFTGMAGVLDLMREYNLTMEQALDVSDHLPIWAEFSIYEGGGVRRVAEAPGPTPK
jgi:endonuclease/exonuclease/phosphatase family metal-dependent hydrolase